MTVGAAAIVSFALLDELDKTLKSLTMPGNPRRGFSGLVPSFNPLAAHDRIAEVGSNWYEFRHGQTITAPSDFTIRWAYVLLDSAVLAIAYPLLLYVFARAIALRLDGDRAEPRLRKSMLTVTQFAMPVLVAIDIAENVTGTSAVQPYAGIEAPSKVTAIAGLLAFAHSMLHAMKWLILIGASIAIVVGAAWLMRRPRAEASDLAWQAEPRHRRTKITRRTRRVANGTAPALACRRDGGTGPRQTQCDGRHRPSDCARVAPTITGDQPSANNGPALRAACPRAPWSHRDCRRAGARDAQRSELRPRSDRWRTTAATLGSTCQLRRRCCWRCSRWRSCSGSPGGHSLRRPSSALISTPATGWV